MREGGLRRGHSPGYRSRSRSRSGSPWSRSRSWDRANHGGNRSPAMRYSRSPARQYSRSPARQYSRSPARPISRSPPRRQRSPLRRQRSRSLSADDSSDEPGQVRDRGRSRRVRGQPPAAEMPTTQQQQQPVPAQASRQTGADEEQQLKALRQQLEAEQVARAGAESKAEQLGSTLRRVADRSKARGTSLAAVLVAVRRVADAKQRLSSAEGELQQALQDAEAFLQDEAAGPPAQQQAQPAPPPPPAQQQQQQRGGSPVGHVSSAANGAEPPAKRSRHHAGAAAEGPPGGGWVQANQDSQQPRLVPLSNIKFSLKL